MKASSEPPPKDCWIAFTVGKGGPAEPAIQMAPSRPSAIPVAKDLSGPPKCVEKAKLDPLGFSQDKKQKFTARRQL